MQPKQSEILLQRGKTQPPSRRLYSGRGSAKVDFPIVPGIYQFCMEAVGHLLIFANGADQRSCSCVRFRHRLFSLPFLPRSASRQQSKDRQSQQKDCNPFFHYSHTSQAGKASAPSLPAICFHYNIEGQQIVNVSPAGEQHSIFVKRKAADACGFSCFLFHSIRSREKSVDSSRAFTTWARPC